MPYIGIDLGGTAIKCALVDEKGCILRKASCPTGVERGYEAVISDMADLALRLVREGGFSLEEVVSVGVGIPGVHDHRRGLVALCPNLYWREVPLIAEMQKKIDKPVYVDNDATVAGLAEAVAGVSAGSDISVFITLGTGVGAGVVIGGRAFSGAHGVGAEIGHAIIKFDGVPCTCGNSGCWERYASATALIRMGREACEENGDSAILRLAGGDMEKITAKTVMDAAKAGDGVALRVFDQYVFGICVGLVNIINYLDPEIIALGGGVSAAGDFLLNAVREKLPGMIFYKNMPYARIELATLGNDAGVIGAALLGKR